mmetsp:Transcript_17576/g.52794  ORF Transcript_17576/g.52794 Transcript_17576/m.52794 type:complete len:107 (-) Transcript_17576:128-448(-)
MCTHRTKYAAQMGMAAATERHSDTGAANSLSAVGLAQQYTKAPHGQQMIAATTPHTNPQVGPTILHLQGLSWLPISIHSMVATMWCGCQGYTLILGGLLEAAGMSP